MNNIALLILRVVFAGSMLYGHGLGKFNKLIQGDLSFANPIGIGEAPTLILAVFSSNDKNNQNKYVVLVRNNIIFAMMQH